MSVAKVVEISSTSTKGFDDAIREGISRATQTLTDVRGAWVKGMKVDVEDGAIVRYRVILKVTFVLNE
jgi:flavin-binding protein dodecin